MSKEPMSRAERIALLSFILLGVIVVVVIIPTLPEGEVVVPDLTNRELLAEIDKALDALPEPLEPCTLLGKDQLLELKDGGYTKYSDLLFYVEYEKGGHEFTSLSLMAPYEYSLFRTTPWGKCSEQDYDMENECKISKADLTLKGLVKFNETVKREMELNIDMATYTILQLEKESAK